MSKRTLTLIVGLIVVILILVLIAVTPREAVAPKPTPSLQPTPTPFAASSMYLSPNPILLASPSGSFDITIDTGINRVTAVQFKLSYEPTTLSNVVISPGDFFENSVVLIRNVDRIEGVISYAIGMPPGGTPKQGQGTVAKVTFRSLLKKGEQTQVDFLPETLVTAEGVSLSVLKSSTGTTIINSPPAQ